MHHGGGCLALWLARNVLKSTNTAIRVSWDSAVAIEVAWAVICRERARVNDAARREPRTITPSFSSPRAEFHLHSYSHRLFPLLFAAAAAQNQPLRSLPQLP